MSRFESSSAMTIAQLKRYSNRVYPYRDFLLVFSGVLTNGTFEYFKNILAAETWEQGIRWLLGTIGFFLLALSGARLSAFATESEAGGSMESVKNPNLVVKSIHRIAIGGACLVVLFGILSSCNGDVDAQRKRLVRIGVPAPLTGDLASYGELVRNGMSLASSEIETGGGSVEILFEDDQCDPRSAVAAYRKLTSIDKVDLFLGPICSGCTMAVGPLAQKDQRLLFTPISSADAISALGSFVFRLAPFDSLQGRAVASWLWRDGVSEVAILNIHNDYGVGLARVFSEEFERLGGRVVARESFGQGETNLRSQWGNISRSGAKAVFAPAYPAEAVRLLKQRQELKIEIPVYGTDPYRDKQVVENAGSATDGIRFTDVAANGGPEWTAFVRAYQARFGKEPNIVAAQAYDSLKVLAVVVRDHGSSPSQVAKGLSELKGYRGATGLIEFDENGDCVTAEFKRYTFKAGTIVPLDGPSAN